MKSIEFPYCCTAKLLVDFGESSVAEGGDQEYSLKQVERFIKSELSNWYTKSLAFFTVVTNNEQSTKKFRI